MIAFPPGPEGVEPGPGFWAELAAAYADPPRHYHTLAHAAEVARCWRALHEAGQWRQPVETWLAALFHDAVYRAGAADNEARSAELARAAIARWLPGRGIDADRVAHLIELTAGHGRLGPADVDPETALFLDCDMAILAADPAAFDAYDRGIAAEYAAIPPDAYRAGRRRFLEGLLARDRIYLSNHFHTRLDAAARANLRRALAG
jgi:predicted metal-dependent HD superfamily phosphohydrolase